MKQILQNLGTGDIEIAEGPCPVSKPGYLLIRSRVTLISPGTERMLLEFGKSNLLNKARQQPDRVKQVFEKVKTDGFIPTLEAVRNKLDKPIPLGYCNTGEILEVGKGIEGLSPGDRVVSNGPHAEIVRVPKNLCAKIPEGIDDDAAAFTVIGAIALQGIRLIQAGLGEYVVVIGLGLIGLTTVQLLIANGCRVLGIDLDPARCTLARQFGAETFALSQGQDTLEAAMEFSQGRGVDGVLITAATKSNKPVSQAAQMCRKRGRIVLVGLAGLELNRSDFYEKELSFQVSCSYGPGRYDPEYEEKGHDYPIGYVRWTEQRNFEAVLDLMTSGRLNFSTLITHRFPFEEAAKAYDLIAKNEEPYLGIILNYENVPGKEDGKYRVSDTTVSIAPSQGSVSKVSKAPVVGLIGAGNFTGQVLLPALKKTKARLKVIASSTGVSGTHLGKKFNFEESTTDIERIFNDPEINTVFIVTRHDTHAGFVIRALNAGKNVFVEKPLCLTTKELEGIVEVYNAQLEGPNSPRVMVGFNRRFSKLTLKTKELLDAVKEPKSMIMTVNAGWIPPDHWTQDLEVGGGRIIGEACHFIDLLRFLVDSKIKRSDMIKMGTRTDDTVTVNLSFDDGSMGTIHYFSNGNRGFPKERLEVFCGGKILFLNNFKKMKGYGWENYRKLKLPKQDKGHYAEVMAFFEAINQGEESPIPFDEIVEVTRTTLMLSG